MSQCNAAHSIRSVALPSLFFSFLKIQFYSVHAYIITRVCVCISVQCSGCSSAVDSNWESKENIYIVWRLPVQLRQLQFDIAIQAFRVNTHTILFIYFFSPFCVRSEFGGQDNNRIRNSLCEMHLPFANAKNHILPISRCCCFRLPQLFIVTNAIYSDFMRIPIETFFRLGDFDSRRVAINEHFTCAWQYRKWHIAKHPTHENQWKKRRLPKHLITRNIYSACDVRLSSTSTTSTNRSTNHKAHKQIKYQKRLFIFSFHRRQKKTYLISHNKIFFQFIHNNLISFICNEEQ